MAEIKHIPVPDIGDFDGVEVIEILVSAGDSINIEDAIVSLESDKAAMEIPSPYAGTVKEVKVNLGDKVSQGDLLLTIEASEDSATATEQAQAETGAKTEDSSVGTKTEAKTEPAAETITPPAFK